MVTLKRAELSDSRFLVYLRNNPDVKKWFRQTKDLSDIEQRKWMSETSSDEYYQFIIRSGGDCGFCALSHIDHVHGRAEFSIAIEPSYHRQNIGEQAMKQLLDIAFHQLGLTKVYSDVFEGNPALSLFKKVGFVEEGILKNHYFKDGKWISSILIAAFHV